MKQFKKKRANQLENNQQITPIANIYDGACHLDILRIAYSKVIKNKGAQTPGSDQNITADKFTQKQIQQLSLTHVKKRDIQMEARKKNHD